MLPIDTRSSLGSSVGVTNAKDSILDQNSLNSIKTMGRAKDPQAMRELSKKFEAMFVSQMLKTMREANDVFAEGSYMDSSEQNFHREMMDQQLVLNLTSGRGIGLADQFYRNMMRDYGQNLNAPQAASGQPDSSQNNLPQSLINSSLSAKPLFKPVTDQGAGDSTAQASASLDAFLQAYYDNSSSADSAQSPSTQIYLKGGKTSVSPSQQKFIASIRPHAEQAAKALNVSPEVIMAQAALETGWGKHVIHTQNGQNSFNLFNIKAGGAWSGDSINVSTLEYKGNKANLERGDFRKYNSYAESFADYVKLLQNNDRYQQALQAGTNSAAYAQALQDAGYATDPDYAAKIRELLSNDLINAEDNSADGNSLLNLASAPGMHLVE